MQEAKPRVLLLQNLIKDYRVPIYNYIAERYDFTVAYTDRDQSVQSCRFNKWRLDTRKVGPFKFVDFGTWRKILGYDAVIVLCDFYSLYDIALPFVARKAAIVSWGIGMRASYTRAYDLARKHTFGDHLVRFVYDKCDANVFYMSKTKEFWAGTKLKQHKIFIAPNTTAVEPIVVQNKSKKDLLFVGTLYKQKGVEQLLGAFKSALERVESSAKLHIVGDGNMMDELMRYVEQNGLASQVVFYGAIYDEKKLAELFQQSILCISPCQAGLSVPKSMGYGVAFATQKNAITGGEIHHITNGVNGLLYDSSEDLKPLLEDALLNSDVYLAMGERAKEYYDNNATPKMMAQGVIDAVDFALANKKDRSCRNFYK